MTRREPDRWPQATALWTKNDLSGKGRPNAAAFAGLLAALGGWFYPTLALPALLLGRQVVMLDIHNPALCLRLFRANREAGLAIAVAILIGWIGVT